MEENEIYEALGIEIPEPSGEDQEKTGPGEEGVAEEQEEAGQEGLEEEVEEPGEPEGEPTHEGEPGENERRIVEEQARANQAAIDEAYRLAFDGRINPYTGRTITSKAEFDDYQAQVRADHQRTQMENLRRAGVDEEAIRAIIDQHPVVQQAQQVIQQAEAERVKAQETQAKGWFVEQLQQINALDPEAKVGRMEDLAAKDQEKYTQMLGMVGRGVSLVDAYKVVNFDALTNRARAAAKQAVRNEAAGKAHLAPSGGQGKAGVEVPSDIREEFRALMPGITDAEIARQYGDYLNKTK